MDARAISDADRRFMIGHVAAKYDVMMSEDDPNFIIVEMNQMALDAHSRVLEGRVLKAVDDRLNTIKAPPAPATGVAAGAGREGSGAGTAITLAVAFILAIGTALVAGYAWHAKFGGIKTATEQFAMLNDTAGMMRCDDGQVQIFPGTEGSWCVLKGRDQLGRTIPVTAWRVK